MNNLPFQNILITGGAGFIGSKLTKALLPLGANIRILDNFSPQVHSTDSLPSDILQSVQLFKADIRDKNTLTAALTGVDSVIHLAAETGTGQSMYEIEHYFDVNVQGTALLLDLLQNDPCGKDVRNLVIASSRAVYGEGAYRCSEHGELFPGDRDILLLQQGKFDAICPQCQRTLEMVPTKETAPFKPLSFYGLTKQIQEQAVLMFGRSKGVNAFALRYQNVFGPGQSLKNPYTGILAVFSNLARQNQDIEIYEDGKESRDFVYIDDVVDATVGCLRYGGYYNGAMNVGSGQSVSVLDVANAIKDHFKSQSKITITGEYRVGDIRHNAADTSEVSRILGFQAKTHFASGLRLFLDWAQSQEVEDKAGYKMSADRLRDAGLMRTSKTGKY
jgi:dTDP-L-rhamnose 4-epimerase